MYPNNVKINPKCNIIRIFKPLLILMLLCGFNFNLSKRRIIQISFKIYSIFLIVIFSYATIYCCNSQDMSSVWSLLEYNVFVAIMAMYTSKINLFFQRIAILDTYLRINFRHYYFMRTKVILFVVLIWLIRIGYIIAFCNVYLCYNDLGLFLIYEFSLLALDFNRVWRFFLFEEIWRRLRLLRKRIEEMPDANFYMYVKDNKALRENKIRFCLFLYRSIADLLDLITPELNASLFISIVCSLPKLILNVYKILLVIDNQLPYESLGFMLMHIFQISLFIFTPSVVVEMYGAEVERISLFLMHQLIKETDEQNKEDLNLFLRYIALRPFKYKVWRVIPLDLSLPVQMVNLCTTYVIVIVNFTQIF